MIHQYKNNGYNMVMDVNSGSVHVVDDIAYGIISLMEDENASKDEILKKAQLLYKKADKKELEDTYQELIDLKEQGMLFSEDVDVWKVQNIAAQRPPVIKALCLHIAHACNMACRYCFADEGEYKGEKALMSFEVGRHALDFLVENSGSRIQLEVDFFGGEPLLNFTVVRQIVAYGRSLEEKYHKKFRFTMTTNGLLLDDEIIAFANKEFDNIVLSIDGRKEVHDHMRPQKDGNGTYEQILPQFIKVAESRHQEKYFVRGTFTHYNLDFAKDVLHLADLGFKEISVEPVVADPKEPYAIKEEDLPVIFEQYDILAKEMIRRKQEGREFHFFHYKVDLKGGPCLIRRISGCGAGKEYLAITPWGDIYPCHQFVEHKEFLMGTVFTGISNRDVRKKFERVNVFTKESCRDCFARYYCSGGCCANAYNASGKIDGPYEIGCQLQRKRIENAIMLQAAYDELRE